MKHVALEISIVLLAAICLQSARMLFAVVVFVVVFLNRNLWYSLYVLRTILNIASISCTLYDL